jgi:prepilin-type processing-associated H-X9-DG protein
MSKATAAGSQPLDYYVEQTPRRRSKTNVLVWVVGTVVLGGMLISVLLPSLCRSSETSNRAKCASNLHQIGLAILLYAQDNSGQYPPSLAVLPGQEQITPAVMICPSSNDEASFAADTAGVVTELSAAETNAPGHKHCLSYVYNGKGLNIKTAPATAIVVYEPLENHQGDGTNVLFGDGHAEWIDKTAWPRAAADAGITLVATPAARP